MSKFGVLFDHRFDAVRTIVNSEESAGGVIVVKDPVKFDLQQGPTCGPVALVVAGQLLGLEVPPVSSVMEYNQKEGYTTVGECFSVDWMASSCRHFYVNSDVEVQDFPSVTEMVKEVIQNGAIYILPYDADRNNSPSLRQGHTAHWAVIIGVYLRDDTTNLLQENMKEFTLPEINEKNTFLVGIQGKSKSPDLWNYGILKNSNLQLNEYPKEDMRMPPGGIQTGLKGRVVRLRPSGRL